MFQTVSNGLLHLFPNIGQIAADFFAFVIENDCPDRTPLIFSPRNNVRKRFISIDFVRRRFVFFAQSAAAHAIDRPAVRDISIGVKRFEFHGVGVKRQDGVLLPNDLRFVFVQNVQNRLIGKVPLSRRRQTAVQSHAVRTGLRIFFKKKLSRPPRRHCVTAGRSHADSVQFFQRLHRLFSCKNASRRFHRIFNRSYAVRIETPHKISFDFTLFNVRKKVKIEIFRRVQFQTVGDVRKFDNVKPLFPPVFAGIKKRSESSVFSFAERFNSVCRRKSATDR